MPYGKEFSGGGARGGEGGGMGKQGVFSSGCAMRSAFGRLHEAS